MIARVPGIGVLSAKRLVDLRRHKRIRFEDLTRLRCSLEKAKPFIVTHDYRPSLAGQGIDGVAATPARRLAYADGALVMRTVRFDGSFQGWRDAARCCCRGRSHRMR